MILWLDYLIFGNGYGLGPRSLNNVFYYIDGELFHYCGGFGAQLYSFQWLTPKPGTRRRLVGHDFVIFNVTRRWFRVQCSWGLSPSATLESLAALKEALNNKYEYKS